MIVAMAKDIRVILIKLADRLHNMRTIEYLGKQKQVQKARETLEVYAPLAHRLGIHALKWELEDLAFRDPAPPQVRRDQDDGRRAARRPRLAGAEGRQTSSAASSRRSTSPPTSPVARSTSTRSTTRWPRRAASSTRSTTCTAMRVIVERDSDEGTRDCYGALGLIHSLWKPMPGRFKDFIAMPKLNRLPLAAHDGDRARGQPLEIQVRTREMHDEAEYGIAAHWLYKRGKRHAARRRVARAGSSQLMDWQQDEADPREFMKTLPHRPLRRRGLRVHAQGRRQDAAGRLRRRSTSPTPSTPTSGTGRSAPRSTAASSRSTTA